MSKRLIDELNAGRIELVEAIDTWVNGELPDRTGDSLHTETLGSVVDRLAIAWVRAHNVTATAATPDLPRMALRQLMGLAQAYDDLVRDLDTGRRRLPNWRPLKIYGTRR